MALFGFFKRDEDNGPVRASSVPKFKNQSALPSDIKTLYRMARFYGGEAEQKKYTNYSYAFIILNRLVTLDTNNEYMAAYKMLGQQYMSGQGCAQNVKNGIQNYDKWMRHVLTNEQDPVKIDEELRTYFKYGFHNYDFLFECVNARIEKDKGQNADPIGMGLYELLLPLWLYSEVSDKLNLYRFNISHYLNFLNDNFGMESATYFTDTYDGNSWLADKLDKFIEEGNILAISRVLHEKAEDHNTEAVRRFSAVRDKNYERLNKLQKNYDPHQSFEKLKEVNERLSGLWDFFCGPEFKLPRTYPFSHNKKSLYEMRLNVERIYKNITVYRHNWSDEFKKFYQAAHPLLQYNHGPVYFMYANLYANYTYRDETIKNQTASYFFEVAKNIGYTKAVNLQYQWDETTIQLAAKLGIKAAMGTLEERSKQQEKHRNQFYHDSYQEYFNEGNYDKCFEYYENHKVPAEMVDLPAVLHGYMKMLEKQIGEDACELEFKVPRNESERTFERNYWNEVRRLELEPMRERIVKLARDYKEPMASYWLGMISYYGRYYDAAARYFDDAILLKGYSYYFEGPVPEVVLEKIKKKRQNAKSWS